MVFDCFEACESLFGVNYTKSKSFDIIALETNNDLAYFSFTFLEGDAIKYVNAIAFKVQTEKSYGIVTLVLMKEVDTEPFTEAIEIINNIIYGD